MASSGITAEASGILTGGWQTDKEHAYVALSRAREQTQVYVAREDLGEQGMDVGAIERLGERMRRSGAQEASIAREVDEKAVERQARIEPEIDRDRVLDAGEKVVVIMRPPSGDGKQAAPVANLTTFRDSKAVEMVHYPSTKDALAAAGI